MAIEKVIDVKANTTEAQAAIEDLGAAAKKTEQEIREEKRKTAEADREAKSAADKAIREVDKLTGGLIGKTQDYYKTLKAAPKAFKSLASSAKSAFATATKGASTFQKALVATGVGALVLALGLVVAYWEDIVSFATGYNKATDEAAKNAKKTLESQEGSLQAISDSENILRLQGKTEEDIQKMKEAQTKEVIKAAKVEIEALKVKKKEELASYNRQRMFIKGAFQVLNAVPLAIAGALDALINSLPEGVREFMGIGTSNLYGALDSQLNSITTMILGTAEEATTETDEALQEAERNLLKMENTQAGYELKRREEANKRAEKAREDVKKNAEELAKAQAEAEANYANRRLELAEQLDKLVYEQQQSAEQREINAVHDKFFALEQEYAGNAEVLAQIEAQKNKELGEINDKYRKEEADKEKEDAEKKRALRQEMNDMILNSANALFDNLKDLNEFYDENDEAAAEKAFNRNKSLQIGQAVMNTAAGIMAQLAVPQDALTGANFAKAATIATTGAVQIATISRQKFKGGGDKKVSSPKKSESGGAASGPSFNIVGASGMNQLQQGINAMLNQPMRAYVVSSEVSSAQSLDRKRIKNATL